MLPHCFVPGPVTDSGGNFYGSLYNPEEPGSRGGPGPGGSAGARGGGRIHIQVGSMFLLDGNIKVDGENGAGGSGGGSGGSVWVEAGENTRIIVLPRTLLHGVEVSLVLHTYPLYLRPLQFNNL